LKSRQDPAAAAKEMERAINSLKFNGFLVNSHTQNAYLDEERFWPILEAAEALGAASVVAMLPNLAEVSFGMADEVAS